MPQGETLSMGDDYAQNIGALAADIAKIRGDIRMLQEAEQSRIYQEREEAVRRHAFWWKLASLLITLFMIPTITVIWQAGRLIERIDNISTQVNNLSADHEIRLRVIEHRPPQSQD